MRNGAAPNRDRPQEEILKKRDAADLDQQYNTTIKRMESDVQASKKDPWANMRGSADAKRK